MSCWVGMPPAHCCMQTANRLEPPTLHGIYGQMPHPLTLWYWMHDRPLRSYINLMVKACIARGCLFICVAKGVFVVTRQATQHLPILLSDTQDLAQWDLSKHNSRGTATQHGEYYRVLKVARALNS